MADSSACRDWYFFQARNDFNLKEITWSKVWGGGGGAEAKQLHFLSSKMP